MHDAITPEHPLNRLLCVHCPNETKALAAWLLSFDERCVQMVSGASEPMLAQIRLQWWRDQFADPDTASNRDPMLARWLAFASNERSDAARRALQLIDSWEMLALADSASGTEDFARTRAEAFSGLLSGPSEEHSEDVERLLLAWSRILARPFDVMTSTDENAQKPGEIPEWSKLKRHGRAIGVLGLWVEADRTEKLDSRAFGLRLMLYSLTGL